MLTLDDLDGRTTCTVQEAGEVLGISRATAYRAARNGDIPAIRISRKVLVPVAQLRRMILGTDGDQAA